eukprot:gene12206-biopygen9390
MGNTGTRQARHTADEQGMPRRRNRTHPLWSSVSPT